MYAIYNEERTYQHPGLLSVNQVRSCKQKQKVEQTKNGEEIATHVWRLIKTKKRTKIDKEISLIVTNKMKKKDTIET